MGILPRKIFKLGGSETLFSALVMKYVSEKLTLKMKMANILQVTIIKITDSKINKSIHRLNVSGSTGPVGGGGGGGSCPPCPPASNGSDRHDSRRPNTNSEYGNLKYCLRLSSIGLSQSNPQASRNASLLPVTCT